MAALRRWGRVRGRVWTRLCAGDRAAAEAVLRAGAAASRNGDGGDGWGGERGDGWVGNVGCGKVLALAVQARLHGGLPGSSGAVVPARPCGSGGRAARGRCGERSGDGGGSGGRGGVVCVGVEDP